MTRADTEQTKVHYKGKDDDFVIIAESPDAVKRWKGDKTVPLVDVVNSFDVFCTHKYVITLAGVILSLANNFAGMEHRASSIGPPTHSWRTSLAQRTQRRLS
jgi:Shwachman-Bodian-Diamond syndrome (SBDS) protein